MTLGESHIAQLTKFLIDEKSTVYVYVRGNDYYCRL